MSHSVDCISFGSCAFDLLLTVEKVPERDQRVAATSARAGGGGPAATASVALRRLGASVAFVSAVGDDVFGRLTMDELTREGIDTSRFQVLRETTSTVSSVVIDATGARSMAVYGGCIRKIELQKIDFRSLPQARSILLDGNNPALAIEAGRYGRSRGIPVLLDGGNIAAADLDPILQVVDIYIPDLQTARKQLGETMSVADMCRHYAASGPSTICITLGEEGSIALENGQIHKVGPASGIEIVDTTGAGDNFHGAFQFCRLQQGWDMRRTLAFCSTFAALTCRGVGGRAAIPGIVETEEHAARLFA